MRPWSGITGEARDTRGGVRTKLWDLVLLNQL